MIIAKHAAFGPERKRERLKNLALLVIDMEADYKLRYLNGTLDDGLSRLKGVISKGRQLGVPIVFFKSELDDARVIGSLLEAAGPAAIEMEKWTFSAVSNPAFRAFLKEREISHTVTAGFNAGVCVRKSVSGIISNGYKVISSRELLFTNPGTSLSDIREFVLFHRNKEREGNLLYLRSAADVETYMEAHVRYIGQIAAAESPGNLRWTAPQ